VVYLQLGALAGYQDGMGGWVRRMGWLALLGTLLLAEKERNEWLVALRWVDIANDDCRRAGKRWKTGRISLSLDYVHSKYPISFFSLSIHLSTDCPI